MTVHLAWPAVTGALSYNVYRSQTSGGPYVKCGITTSAQWDDINNLPKDVVFYYVVTSVNNNGESLFSAQVTATPLSHAAAPTGIVATIT